MYTREEIEEKCKSAFEEAAAGIVLFIFIVIYTLVRGKKCEANPWGEGADTLEWTVESPAPFHTHEELPRIR